MLFLISWPGVADAWRRQTTVHFRAPVDAAAAAIDIVAAWPGLDLIDLFRCKNEALRPTRGVASVERVSKPWSRSRAIRSCK
jgi:hypothetical protein